MINVKQIMLTTDELEKCIEFSKASAPTQQDIEFGQNTTKPRKPEETARDTLIGKIAETAFKKIMKENYGLDVPLDFNIYPRGKYDDQDAEINGWRIDVKGTREGGRYMLIEWSKLNFCQRENKLSHLYLMFSVGWDRNEDLPTGIVSYEGAALIQRLSPNCETTRILRKKENLPETKMELQADNYAIRFQDLNKDLDQLVDYLIKNKPSPLLTDNFLNPYTGQTTVQIMSERE